MSIRGVVGIGIGERDGQPVVLVMLDRPAAQLERPIPARLDDVPVEVEVVGEISAF